MFITDPAEEYFKDGLWAYDATASAWVKLLADDDSYLKVAEQSAITGFATSANQDTIITALQLIDDLRGALDSVDTDELVVNVDESALPTGAATSLNQTSMISSLATIATLNRALHDVGTDELRTIPYPHGIWGIAGITQVNVFKTATNQTVVAYTVPSGKTFYLTHVYLTADNTSGAAATGRFYMRTGAPAEVVRWQMNLPTDGHFQIAWNLNPPIQAPEDYDFPLTSGGANYTISATIHGYTV